MLYLNKNDLSKVGTPWKETISTIEKTVQLLKTSKFDQPIKPYLNFDNPHNRIIAMPARIGSDRSGVSGIKWIASFPENIKKGKSRANSVTILNNSLTGEPFAILNTSLVSALRTASVTGYFLQKFFEFTQKSNQNVLIIGFGPIGQYHLKMLLDNYAHNINKVSLFDFKAPNLADFENSETPIHVTQNLEHSFKESDIVITATTSDKGYLNFMPKKNSLHLNISLRDYSVDMQRYFDEIIVDSWNEICRAGTDIERMHDINGLKKEQCSEITNINKNILSPNKTIFFNPMGMAVFDIAIANFVVQVAHKSDIGIYLE